MRTAPVIIAARDEKEAVENALLQTRLTHGYWSVCNTVRRLQESFGLAKHWMNIGISNFLQIPIVRR